MRIELVGGPSCGTRVEVEFLNRVLVIQSSFYRRRDRPYDTLDRIPVHSANGDRFYDYVKPDQRG